MMMLRMMGMMLRMMGMMLRMMGMMLRMVGMMLRMIGMMLRMMGMMLRMVGMMLRMMGMMLRMMGMMLRMMGMMLRMLILLVYIMWVGMHTVASFVDDRIDDALLYEDEIMGVVTLALQCTQTVPADRPSMPEALEVLENLHDFAKGIRMGIDAKEVE
ncbi:unnamed protein product [Closterium sp. NIES-54]